MTELHNHLQNIVIPIYYHDAGGNITIVKEVFVVTKACIKRVGKSFSYAAPFPYRK